MGRVLVVTLTFLVIQRHVHPQSSGEKLLVAMVTRSTWGVKETCADLEFHGFRDGETAKVEEKTYLNVTFHLSTTKCTTLPTWFRVKVSFHQANFTVDVCSIIFERQICDISDKSTYCHCVNDWNGAAQLYREFNMSGNVSYIWSLSDTTSGQMQKKAQIVFDVSKSAKDIVDASDRAEPVDPASPAPPAPTEPPQVEKQDAKTEVRPRTTRASLTTRRVVQPSLDPVKVDPGNTDVSTPSAGVTADGVNLQVIFFNSIITACVIGIPIFIVLVIYIYRRRKVTATVAAATAAAAASESQPPAAFRPRPREPDTTMGIKRRLQTRTRPPSAQEEAEYTEIVYELQTDETSSTRAHENYELPIHKEGEDQSEYSRLEYKGLWHSGVRLEPDTKQTKMDEPSPPAFTLKEIPDDYLEPVPVTEDKKT